MRPPFEFFGYIKSNASKIDRSIIPVYLKKTPYENLLMVPWGVNKNGFPNWNYLIVFTIYMIEKYFIENPRTRNNYQNIKGIIE